MFLSRSNEVFCEFFEKQQTNRDLFNLKTKVFGVQASTAPFKLGYSHLGFFIYKNIKANNKK